MNYPAPRSPRDLFQLFSLLDRRVEFESLLNRIDLTGVLPWQIYSCVLGRAPEDAEVAFPRADYSAREHLGAAVRSPEFQNSVLERLLRSFPEYRRLLFCHIPRTSGNSITNALLSRYPILPLSMSNGAWVDHTTLCDLIRSFVLEAAVCRSVFVPGHMRLNYILDRGLCRFEDRLFTVVRDPLDILISQTNYIATVLREDAALARPDTLEWRARLGLDIPSRTDDGFFAKLAKRIHA
jgi:hypothetical protein